MIEAADTRVRELVSAAAKGVETWLDPPRADEKREGVGLYLVELAESSSPQGGHPAPLQLELRYLVTVWASSVEKEHELLGQLAFAALSDPELEATFRPLDAALWAAFGVAPRASFVLHVPVRLERQVKRPRPVREVRTRFVTSRAVEGIVLGPNDVAMAGARVELPHLGLSASTGHDGRFRFARVPDEEPLSLRVVAKGLVQEVKAAPPTAGAPLTIRMKPGEA